MRFLAIFAVMALGIDVASAGEFKVSVPAFESGSLKAEQYADVMGCKGKNLSPAVSWSGAPKGTKSFVVTMYDKDAPTGSGWWHWVVVDIPGNVTSLDEGAGSLATKLLPKGARMTETDMRENAFLGACPPKGETHEYRITVKALKVERLDMPANASPALVGFMSNMNKLAEASVVAKGNQ